MEGVSRQISSGQTDVPALLYRAIFAVSILLLVAVPLTFSTAVHRFYTLPRFVVLILGSSMLLVLLCSTTLVRGIRGRTQARDMAPLLKSRIAMLLVLYVICIAVSTLFGVAPLNCLFGSFENQMGLITYGCFLTCFIGLVTGVGRSRTRFKVVLWAMVVTSLLVSVYAVAQFFKLDPFVPASLYTFRSSGGSVVRPSSTIGHADYLGNFLLYSVWIAPTLAIASNGRWRRIASLAFILMAAAIAFTGTRGAWLGAMAGGIVFASLRLPALARRIGKLDRRLLIRVAALVLISVAVSSWLILSNPTSRSLVVRAKSFLAEGLTGSGRTLLWRDSIKMIPAFAVTGTGPEGFRKAFLKYKSFDLARLAPQTNNESSHSSYLDAAISYGLLGLAAYVGIVCSAFLYLRKVYGRSAREEDKTIVAGLISSFSAVVVHNFFIFDQIPTGLYFFALLGVVQITPNLMTSPIPAVSEADAKGWAWKDSKAKALRVAWAGLAVLVSLAACGAAASYSISLIRADTSIRRAFSAAQSGNLEKVTRLGELATQSAEPTRAYDFLSAQALVSYADRFKHSANSFDSTDLDADPLSYRRDEALEAADVYARRSLEHTLTPDSACLLLAYIAFSRRDHAGLRTFAAEAVNWDPNFSNSRWLRAEAYLSESRYEDAASEAQRALDLNGSSQAARRTLERAQQLSIPREQLIQGYIARGRAAAESGKIRKAERILVRALRLSDAACPECHRLLARLYEATNRLDEASTQWRLFALEDPIEKKR